MEGEKEGRGEEISFGMACGGEQRTGLESNRGRIACIQVISWERMERFLSGIGIAAAGNFTFIKLWVSSIFESIEAGTCASVYYK